MNRSDARLLVVDDSASMRMCTGHVLRQLGFVHIDEASNGALALTKFQSSHYDLVITGWYMPHLGGLQLLQAIRGGRARQGTPVMVLTGSVTSASLQEALEAGATGYIAKPFFKHSLSEQVTRLVALMPHVPRVWDYGALEAFA